MSEQTSTLPEVPEPTRENFDPKWPHTEEELLYVIRDVLRKGRPESLSVDDMIEQINNGTYEMPESYSLSADAMWQAALAAFNYVAHVLGTTGWQASWAELRFLSESRGWGDRSFAIIDSHDLLYPQYDLRAKVEGYIEKWLPEVADRARESLADEKYSTATETVRAHWEMLAAAYPPRCPLEGCEVSMPHGHGTD